MKFIAITCPLLQNSPGAALIRSYQLQRDLTSQYMRTKKALRRRQALIAEKTKECILHIPIVERTRETNVTDCLKLQLDDARASCEAAIDALVRTQPGPSSSYAQKLQRTYSTSLHMQDTLEESYTWNKHSLDVGERAERIRRRYIQHRNKTKNVARSSGTK